DDPGVLDRPHPVRPRGAREVHDRRRRARVARHEQLGARLLRAEPQRERIPRRRCDLQPARAFLRRAVELAVRLRGRPEQALRRAEDRGVNAVLGALLVQGSLLVAPLTMRGEPPPTTAVAAVWFEEDDMGVGTSAAQDWYARAQRGLG